MFGVLDVSDWTPYREEMAMLSSRVACEGHMLPWAARPLPSSSSGLHLTENLGDFLLCSQRMTPKCPAQGWLTLGVRYTFLGWTLKTMELKLLKVVLSFLVVSDFSFSPSCSHSLCVSAFALSSPTFFPSSSFSLPLPLPPGLFSAPPFLPLCMESKEH